MDAAEMIDRLGLEPHPEGGWFRQTFCDERPDGSVPSTAIYYLLARGERSHWHRVINAAEVWHHYAGDALRLSVADRSPGSADGREVPGAGSGDGREVPGAGSGDGREVPVEHHTLGVDVVAGERPQVIVPAGHWQSAEPLGEWTLVGCTVAPGFDFANFELAHPNWRPEQ